MLKRRKTHIGRKTKQMRSHCHGDAFFTCLLFQFFYDCITGCFDFSFAYDVFDYSGQHCAYLIEGGRITCYDAVKLIQTYAANALVL